VFSAADGVLKIIEGIGLGTGGTVGGAVITGTGVGAIAGVPAIVASLSGAAALIGVGIIEIGASIALIAAGMGNLGSDSNDFEYYNKLDCDLTKYSENWGRGREATPKDNLLYHYNKHRTEVNARNLEDYARKAENFMKSVLDNKIKGTRVPGFSENVYRHRFNGKYIELEYITEGYNKVYKIISYGKQ
jgi:hypothetical protein